MRLMGDLLVVTGVEDHPLRHDPPDYLSLVRPDRRAAATGEAAVAGAAVIGGCTKEELLNLVQVRCNPRSS